MDKPIEQIVPGVDTPREDDIVTACAGCGETMIHAHPKHITGGSRLNDAGEWEDHGPLSDEEIAERIEKMSGSRCVSCGPGE